MVYRQDEWQATPYQENFIDLKIANQGRKIKKNICKANGNWNCCNVQFYCNNLEWIKPKTWYSKKNPLFYFNCKLYIKYGN